MQNDTTANGTTPSTAYIAVRWDTQGVGFRAAIVAYVKADSPKEVLPAMQDYLQRRGFTKNAAQYILQKSAIHRIEK